MDIVTLSQWQFAITTIYHFFFVPLTLGLSVLVAVMETIYATSGNEVYKRMAKFWGRLFLINFAMGVVTGIVQEFQFGMNWSEYSPRSFCRQRSRTRCLPVMPRSLQFTVTSLAR